MVRAIKQRTSNQDPPSTKYKQSCPWREADNRIERQYTIAHGQLDLFLGASDYLT
jgi:hypothetical protein